MTSTGTTMPVESVIQPLGGASQSMGDSQGEGSESLWREFPASASSPVALQCSLWATSLRPPPDSEIVRSVEP